jgi:hypothetical protein
MPSVRVSRETAYDRHPNDALEGARGMTGVTTADLCGVSRERAEPGRLIGTGLGSRNRYELTLRNRRD